MCTPSFPFPKRNGMFCTHSRPSVPEMGVSLWGGFPTSSAALPGSLAKWAKFRSYLKGGGGLETDHTASVKMEKQIWDPEVEWKTTVRNSPRGFLQLNLSCLELQGKFWSAPTQLTLHSTQAARSTCSCVLYNVIYGMSESDLPAHVWGLFWVCHLSLQGWGSFHFPCNDFSLAK